MKTGFVASIGALGLAALASQAFAAGASQTHDLRPVDSSATINDAIFQQMGSNVVPGRTATPIVRLDAQWRESGYNTDGRGPLFGDYDMVDDPATRSVALNSLATTNIGGADYHQFMLELNQFPTEGASEFQMIDLKVYLGAAPDTLIDGSDPASDLGVLVYDLHTDSPYMVNFVQMADNNEEGGDYLVWIPVSLFTGVADEAHPFVYLFSTFTGADAGYEQWSAITSGQNPTAIPLPAAAWSGLSLLGVMGLGMARRRMRQLVTA